MKSFKEYLIEQEKINYDVANVTALRKHNLDVAKNLLKKNKDFIDDFNNAENINQYDTEEQRDLAVAAYIVSKEDPEFAKKIGLDPTNPDTLNKEIKNDFIDSTRHTAVKLGINNPTIKQIKGSTTEPSDQTQGQEKEQKAEPKVEPKTTEPEDKTQDQNDNEEQDQEPEPQKKDTEDKGPTIDTEKFPNPENIAKEIDDQRKQAEEQIKQYAKDNPDQTDQRVIDNAIKRLNTRLDKLKNDAQKQITPYSVNPTRISKVRASTKAQNALDKARTEAKILTNNVVRKQLPSRLSRTAKRIGEVGQSAGQKIKQVAQSRTAKNIGAAAGRAATLGKEAAGRAIKNIQQSSSAKQIAQYLGQDRANEYINYLRNNENEKAQALAQEAKKAREAAQKEQRLNRMSQRVSSEQNKTLRQAAQGKGGARAAAEAKKATDKFRNSA